MTELSVPTNRRERFLAALPLPQRRTETADSDPLLQLLFRVLGGTPTRCVTHRDRDQDGRERLLAMLYAGSGDTPFAIGKVQSDLRNGSLQPEADALARVRTILPEPLLASVPQVLHMHASDEGEVLVTSFLPGRSAWFEMQASLLPSLRVAAHFAAAARWL
ncbi:MAG TPA: hypothetical protein VJZ00_24205, partial [Thermoanaerobaculia bacterium]|nr:hypothetical protein [Thermoanaerobaculia bacterium]